VFNCTKAGYKESGFTFVFVLAKGNKHHVKHNVVKHDKSTNAIFSFKGG
jgi:hypothetical protein